MRVFGLGLIFDLERVCDSEVARETDECPDEGCEESPYPFELVGDMGEVEEE